MSAASRLSTVGAFTSALSRAAQVISWCVLKRCVIDQTATGAFSDNSVKGLDARIQLLSPAKPVAPEAEQFATVVAALGYDKEHVKALDLGSSLPEA